MNVPVTGGGSIPVNAAFAKNLGVVGLTSGSHNLGNQTRGLAPTTEYGTGVTAIAEVGDWYQMPPGSVYGVASTLSVSGVITIDYGEDGIGEWPVSAKNLKFDLVHPLDNLKVLGQKIQLEHVRVRLSSETAPALYDLGYITLPEYNLVMATHEPEPPSVVGTVGKVATTLTVIAIVAAAIWFLPRTGGA